MTIRRRVLAGLLFVGLLAIPATLSAQEIAEAHKEVQENHELPWKWANFAILVGVLGYLISKKSGGFFAARTASIQQGIADAAARKSEADQRAAEMEARLANLDAEITKLRREAREELAKESTRLEEETRQLQIKIQQQADQEITAAMNVARQRLKSYAANLAFELAEQEVRRRINPQIQNELVNRFGQELGRVEKVQ